jgi:hypothetical protein
MFKHVWQLSIEIFLVYQQILNVFEKNMANDNWLQLKIDKKHRLCVNFLYVAINLSCMKK